MNFNTIPLKSIYYHNSKISQENLILISRLSQGKNFTLNSTGKEIWGLIDGERSIEKIAMELATIYAIEYTKDTLTDVLNLLKELWKNGFLEWKSMLNPFLADYKIKYGDFQIENLILDTVKIFHQDTETFHKIFDAFVYEDIFDNVDTNVASAYLKRCFFFVATHNNKPIANLALQLDIHNLLSQITYFSIHQKHRHYNFSIKNFINKSSLFAMKQLNSSIVEASVSSVFAMPKDQEFLWKSLTDEFVEIGILKDEVQEGDVSFCLINK